MASIEPKSNRNSWECTDRFTRRLVLARVGAALLVLLVLVSMNPIARATLPEVDADGKPFPSLTPMLHRVSPAVVSINAFSEWQQSHKPQQSLGSGVIVDSAMGLVVTNYHIVQNASEINVGLADGRDLSATLVGTDPGLDIAVLRIGNSDLVAVKIADSKQIEVGDYMVAIGRTVDFGQTVTTGIVSALGSSSFELDAYANFFQTDASINPGNSGGALVNLAGELVGINTAIVSPAGGKLGTGFVIPANMAIASLRQMIESGLAQLGLTGLTLQDLSPRLRDAFGLSDSPVGVLVAEVEGGSWADAAGVEVGDIFLQVDGEDISWVSELRGQINRYAMGSTFHLLVLRDRREKDLYLTLGSEEADDAAKGRLPPLLVGVIFNLGKDGKSLVLSQLEPNSSAAANGLRLGDVIVTANRRPVSDLSSLKLAIQDSPDKVLLLVNRGADALYIVFR